MIIAKTARDGSTPGKILLNERAHHLALETILLIDYVIRDANFLGHPPGIVNILERTAAALHRFRHAFVPCKSPLVPKLHGQPNHVVPFGTQHGRDYGGIDSARHGYGDGLGGHEKTAFSSWLFALSLTNMFQPVAAAKAEG
jgi:hypothetical protein